ncbi:MDN1, partial [Symbiodinium necroappetens]
VILGRVADLRLRRAFLSCLAPIWSLGSGIAEALLQERPTVTLLLSSAPEKVQIGSITLPLAVQGEDPAVRCAPFAYTSVHARILQALASAIRADEPALLVGDTGTGKTSVVQHIGRLLGQEVLVYNFNEQSESTELIGGFRPVDNVMQLMSELVELFCSTFEKSFSRRKNARLLEKARGDFLGRRWASVLHSIGSVMSKAQQSLSDPVTQASKGVKGTHLAAEWERVQDLHRKASTVVAAGSAPRFEFKEGLLVQALRSGAWVVLDEINLAPSDLLQRVQGLIERSSGSHLALPESGDEHVVPHPEFRLFACMNPPRLPPPAEAEGEEDVPMSRAGQAAGKKELPPGIRARFTEIFVDEEFISRCYFAQAASVLVTQCATASWPRRSRSPMSVSPPKPRPLQAHDLKKKVFVVPTWCDICKGVLVGHGFVCAGPCQMRCHRGLGANGAENCKAELLMKKCEEVAHVQGQYQFGDVTKQIFRNEKQRIKDLVVTEFVKEQASFGKFDKLKAYSEALQEWWDEDRVVRYMLFAIASIELVLLVISYSSVFLCAWPVHGASRAGRLAWLQAVSNCTSAAVFEGLLLLLIHVLATQLLVYSDLVHSFVREILQINLSELQIDVGKAADAVTNITIHGLKTTACIACLGMALWMRAVQLVYDNSHP